MCVCVCVLLARILHSILTQFNSRLTTNLSTDVNYQLVPTNQMAPETTQMSPQKQRPRNKLVDLLAILFGVSSWIGVTSTFIQLPLIVSTAPEGWQLPSYIAVTVQLANVGSFAYVIYQKYSSRKIDDGLLIYVILTIGCIAAICMAFFYQDTMEINGTQHSVALLLFTLFFALVGCMSSVLFMPYMGRFRECYLITYMLGMGLSGFVSSIMAMVQGVGGSPQCIPTNSTDGPAFTKYVPPPLFGSQIYFLFVFAMFVMSTIAFVLLNSLKVCKNEYASVTIGQGNKYQYDEKDENGQLIEKIPENVRNLSTFNYCFLMFSLMGLASLGNGIFPAMATYAFLPYGNTTYHFAVTLAAIATPVAGFIAMYLPHTSIRVVRVLCTIATCVTVYIFFIAVNSPNPLLQDSVFGSILIVRTISNDILLLRNIAIIIVFLMRLFSYLILSQIASWTTFNCTISYMKISIVAIFRYQEGRSLVHVGAVNQISSAIGAMISFALINFTTIFISYDPCS